MEERDHDALFKKRTICLNDRVNDREAARISEMIILLNAESEAPITLYINSAGGNMDAALSIYDALRYSVAPVIGIVQQKAFSAASVVLQGCRVRKALKHAQILIHNGGVTMDKRFDDIEADAEAVIRAIINDAIHKRKLLHAIYADCTGRTEAEIRKICRADKAMFADEAKELGFIDEVI